MIAQISHFKRVMLVAFFIALKNIQRGSIAVKLVTVFILLLTFLNLTVVGGLLNGIIEDVGVKIKTSLLGDVYVEPLKEYDYIQTPDEIINYIKSDPDVAGYSARLLAGATLESGYKEITGNKIPNRVRASVSGITVENELKTTNISQRVLAGRFLDDSDWNAILLGSDLVEGYVGEGISGAGAESTLGHVEIGEKIRLRFSNGIVREFTVVGILNAKSAAVDQRAYVNYKELQQIMGFQDNRYSEISIAMKNSEVAKSLVDRLNSDPNNHKNEIKTFDQAIPSAIEDVKMAFALIGNIVGAIAVLVGLVTVFVIIFVNASSRRRYLGILKAQGIEPTALILSYVFQALFYTVIGVGLGIVVLYGFLQGYFESHPIAMPMADGSLLLGFDYVTIRMGIMIVTTIISAFVPAWFIIRQNTLNSILGR